MTRVHCYLRLVILFSDLGLGHAGDRCGQIGILCNVRTCGSWVAILCTGLETLARVRDTITTCESIVEVQETVCYYRGKRLVWLGGSDSAAGGRVEYWLDLDENCVHWVNAIHGITYLIQPIDFPQSVQTVQERVRYCVTVSGMVRCDDLRYPVYMVYANDQHSFYLDQYRLKHFVKQYDLVECFDCYQMQERPNDTLQDTLDQSRSLAKIIAHVYSAGQPRRDFPVLV